MKNSNSQNSPTQQKLTNKISEESRKNSGSSKKSGNTLTRKLNSQSKKSGFHNSMNSSGFPPLMPDLSKRIISEKFDVINYPGKQNDL